LKFEKKVRRKVKVCWQSLNPVPELDPHQGKLQIRIRFRIVCYLLLLRAVIYMYGYQKFMAFLQTERDKKTIGNCNTTSNLHSS
jgi:hypothetical protein